MASEQKLPPPPDFDPAEAELSDQEIAMLQPAATVFAQRGIPLPPTPRGRPKAVKTKVPVTIRLDADVVEHFKAGGRGWQTRMGEVLSQAVAKGKRSA